METATFSSKRKPPPPPPSSSKTAASGGYFSTSYDDVFGGPPKFATTASSALAPRAEDYSEIFSGFRNSSSSRASSSIPVLDLPAVIGDDFGSVMDYSDVFGGLNSVDFAVPFDELFRSSDGFDASDDDDAWTPIGTESLSNDSDPFAFSEKSQNFLNGNANQPLEGKQHNVSYHKVNPGTSTCIPDAIHVTQLDDFPEYTCVVEEATSLRVMDQQKFCSQAVENIVINMKSPPIITHKHHEKSQSHHSHEDMGLKSLERDPRSCRSHSASLSHVNTVSASDIKLPTNSSHFTPPSSNSGSPAGPGERNKGTNGLSSGPKAFENCGFETTVDGSIPPFFDMEVDASSSAAVTAAAMKDVMEKAQAKLKAAKEFRGRKDNFQNGGEVVLETEINGGENVGLARMECVSEEGKLPGKIERGSSKIKSYSKARHGRSLSQILPDTIADEQPIGVSEQPTRIKCNFPLDVSSNDVGGEWKEAKQYFEFVSNDNSRLAYQPPNKGDGKDETYKEQDSNDNDSDSSRESFVPQTNRRRLKATKAVSRQGYYERMFKVAQEVHDTITSGHAETKEEVQDIFHEDRNEQIPDSIIEPERNEGNVWDSHRAEVIIKAKAEIKSKNVPENEYMEARETKASYTALNSRGGNDTLVNMTNFAHYIRDGESEVKGTWEREENGNEAHEGIVKLSKETLEQRKNKESWEVKGKRSKVAFGGVFSGERLQTTIESKEEDRTKDLQKMKAECWRPTEVLEAKVAGQKLDRSCEELDNYKTTESQQINEHDGHLGKATKDQGPEMMLDENVKLEKCWEYLETLEQEKSRMNLEKDCKLVGENYYADNQNKNEEEKCEVTSEKRNVHLGEETDFKVDLKGGFRSQAETEEEDEDQQSDSSSDIELSINDTNQKSSGVVNVNGEDVDLDGVHCILKVPHINTNGFLEASSGKDKSEIDSKVLDDNYVKGFETADVHIDAKQSRSDTPQADPSNQELEGKPDATPIKMSDMKGDGSVEISAGEENGEIGTVLSEETSLKDVETAGVMGERQTVFPAAQECPIADELERRPSLRMNEKNTTSADVSSRHGQFIKKENTEVADAVSDPNLVKGSHLEPGGMLKKIGVDQVLGGMEENNRSTQYEKKNGWNEHLIKRVGVDPIIPDRKQCFQRTSQVSSFSQNIERNGKIFNHKGSLEEKDDDRKIDLEKEHLIKLEEEREREREREKDKMAVEIAIREARERAALERATEEIRQKAMSEARERLEKACSEAREKSLSDKTSEARLRAERAAVERATSEARQRAFEKSMADRAMFETRERVQRTMSEKFISERDEIMRQNSFPSTSERFELATGEPAERCKARLERHRRTVERVAKALEEKNHRDFLAQREQAERNRFAETLDTDIKRWSNGKAGNLRALLSTLHYILGPDSGWQPIPLTEVITAAAVKKAYRKATLCVHPDKLQQRGASIQQKYISEKVFDLLKDAWNRFNSEEK